MDGAIRRGVGRLLLCRWTIAGLNLLIGFVAVSALADAFSLLMRTAELLPGSRVLGEAMEIITGIGVILIGYGVAQEDRATLREIFGLSGPDGDDHEAGIDRSCHRYGLGILILGLFSEIGAQCVRIPDRVIDTSKIEHLVLGFSSVLLLIGVALLAVQTLKLVTASRAEGAGTGAGH